MLHDDGQLGVESGGAAEGPADPAPLRALFDRLREHVAHSEARAHATLSELKAAADAQDDPEAFRNEAVAVARRQRGAAHGLSALADELRGMAEALEARLGEGDDRRGDSLRRMELEIRGAAQRLESQACEAEAWTEGAFGRLAAELGRWEAAASARDEGEARAFAVRLDEAEARRDRGLATLLSAARDDLSGPAEPRMARPNPRPAGGARSAAMLLSAGVACLGLVTMSVVLEPTFKRSDAASAIEALTLRGPIFVAPPRYAEEGELAVAPIGPGAPRALAGPAAERAVAAAIAAVEAGRGGAVARLRDLAEQGAPRAQMFLARLYEEGGSGLSADVGEARRWTARAADTGDPVAMHNLALYYLQGRGGPRDDAMAARLFRRSAAAGLADSQFNLGLLYETGAGVDRNLVEAYQWFQIAATNGDLKARSRAVALEDRLSSREVARAEQVVARFAPGAAEPEETVVAPGTATIAEAQKKLARLGYYIGPTDGQDTPGYRAAVEAYRRDRGGQPARVAAALP